MKVYNNLKSKQKIKEDDIVLIGEGKQVKELFKVKFKLGNLTNQKLFEKITEIINKKRGFNCNEYEPSSIKHMLEISEIPKGLKKTLEYIFEPNSIISLDHQINDILTCLKDNITYYNCQEDIRIFEYIKNEFIKYKIAEKYMLMLDFYLALYKFQIKHYVEAEDILIKIIKRAKSIKNIELHVKFTKQLIYIYEVSFDKYKNYNDSLKTISINKKDLINISYKDSFEFKNTKSLFLNKLRKHQNALKLLFENLKEVEDNEDRAKTHLNIGFVNSCMGNVKNSIKHYKLAFNLTKNNDMIILILNNLIYGNMKINNLKEIKKILGYIFNLLDDIDDINKIIAFHDTYLDYQVYVNEKININRYVNILLKAHKMNEERRCVYLIIDKIIKNYENYTEVILKTLMKMIEKEENIEERNKLKIKFSDIIIERRWAI